MRDSTIRAHTRDRLLTTAVATAATWLAVGCGTESAPPNEIADELALASPNASASTTTPSAALVPLPLVASFPVQFSVPPTLATYSGLAPVTFGVPFAQGKMLATHKRRMVVTATKIPIEADFTITATWPDGSVKWLLVDANVQVASGAIAAAEVQYGAGVTEFAPTQPITVVSLNPGLRVRVNSKLYDLTATSQDVGRFDLTSFDFRTNQSLTFTTEAKTTSVVEEKAGKVRETIKLSGVYRSADGSSTGEFVTRMRFYARTPYVRVYHTMTWTDSAQRGISSLAFVPKRAIGPTPQFIYAADGTFNKVPALDLFQTGPSTLVTATRASAGKRFDGFIEANWGTAAANKLFVGLRWPWQQFPVRAQGVSALGSNSLTLHAIGPRTPMSLAAAELASPAGPPLHLERFEDPYTNLRAHMSDDALFHPNNMCGGVQCPVGTQCSPFLTCVSGPPMLHPESGAYSPALSPKGVAKTYEYLVWESNAADASTGHAISPQHRNALLQTPIVAYADPAHAVLAGLPSPVSAKDTAAFPEIEGAMDRAFDRMMLMKESEGDYGTFNFGDVQYDWTSDANGHVPPYRYWLNHGKGWSPIPWLLYLRSGDRKYLERGESYARHLMDVDTCHVTDDSLRKYKGGQIGYGPIHFGSDTFPIRMENESEYLGLYYYLTGYERAKDVIEERRIALKNPTNQADIFSTQDMLNYLSPAAHADWKVRFNREHYLAIGELAAVYELTQDPVLLDYANQFILRLKESQADNGWLPGIKTNHWFSNSLTLAHRVFPAHATTLADILNKYEQHLGNYAMPNPTGPRSVDGPTSFWTLVLLEQATGNSHYLEVAAKTALAQALSVHKAPNEWNGLSEIPEQYQGAQIRGWAATLARLASLPPAQRPTGVAPMNYFSSGLLTQLPAQGGAWDGRHVFYVLDSNDATLNIDLDFNVSNQGSYHHTYQVRVYAPDGSIAFTKEGTIDTPPTELGSFGYYCAAVACGPAYDKNVLSNYRRGTSIPIPPDGKLGAYAVEILSNDGSSYHRSDLPIWARSSGGKLVHFFPNFVERSMGAATPNPPFLGLSPYDVYQIYVKDGGTAVAAGNGPSNTYSGQIWYKPKAIGQPITLGYFSGGSPLPDTPQATEFTFAPTYYSEWPRVVAYRPGFVHAGETALTNTDSVGNPVGTPCSFVPTTLGLHSAVVTNSSWHFSLHIDGIRPFISATEAEWFDPELVAHKPISDFLSAVALP